MDKLCKIRDLQRCIMQFENEFSKIFGIGLNEGMALCSLKNAKQLTSGELSELMGLTPSNTSKVLRSVEDKGLVIRLLGKEDKRQMYFSLSPAGKKLIEHIARQEIKMPECLEKVVDPEPGCPTA